METQGFIRTIIVILSVLVLNVAASKKVQSDGSMFGNVRREPLTQLVLKLFNTLPRPKEEQQIETSAIMKDASLKSKIRFKPKKIYEFVPQSKVTRQIFYYFVT